MVTASGMQDTIRAAGATANELLQAVIGGSDKGKPMLSAKDLRSLLHRLSRLLALAHQQADRAGAWKYNGFPTW